MILRYLLVADEPLSDRTSYPRPQPLILPPTSILESQSNCVGHGSTYRQAQRTRIAKVTIPGVHQATKGNQRGYFQKTAQMVHGYKLSPAVLRSCQRLLLEGLPVLYHENTLVVQLSVSNDFPHASVEAFEAYPSKIILTSRNSHNIHPSQWDKKAQSMIARFERIELRMPLGIHKSEYAYTHTRSMIRMLGAAIAEKTLNVHFAESGKISHELWARSVKTTLLAQCEKIAWSGPLERVLSAVTKISPKRPAGSRFNGSVPQNKKPAERTSRSG